MAKCFCVNCNLYWHSLYSIPTECPLCKGKRIIVDEKKHKQEGKLDVEKGRD